MILSLSVATFLAVMFHLSVNDFGFVHLSNLSVFAVQVGSPDSQMKCSVQKLLFLKKKKEFSKNHSPSSSW